MTYMVGFLDTTNHDRAIRNRQSLRRGRRGPSRKDIKRATDDVADHDIPGTIGVGSAQIIRDGVRLPFDVEARTVTAVSVTRGDPQHGAHRSEDHIGRYEVEFPLLEADPEVVPGSECPECGGERGVYKYRAHHHIAGSESIFCLDCETRLANNEWG